MPMLVMLERREEGFYVPGRMVRAADLVDDWAKAITRSGKPSPSW
jgi:nitrate reductase alpha subunit